MKHKILLLLFIFPLFAAKCEGPFPEDDSVIEEYVVGNWTLTHVNEGEGFEEIWHNQRSNYIIFYQDGTFESSGYFGNTGGYYYIQDGIIECSADDRRHMRFKVWSICYNKMEASLYEDGYDTVRIKMKRR
ncbi:hypothetical protein M2132_001295 [Dysgonomonas sp. PH5-45]|uniref:hypothetical protein n=1 Tax=unclassified Dysgonomonas TaxID=2630389 RepID=UPI002476DAD1|nr:MULTISPECIES: hypothetical protein [unclassified Dysgonomonas]MDH6354958.1 hypothetical protein [Dysgonomonas sp. PH5-45]